MSVYSKAEIGLMQVAFSKLFNPAQELLAMPSLVEWMEKAPVTIVEFDGYLNDESRESRDRRMELHEVYEGDIKALVGNLRGTYRNLSHLTKWELIFKVANEIMDVQKVLERAESEYVFNDETVATPQTEETQLSNQGISTEEEPEVPAVSTKEETATERVHEENVQESVEQVIPETVAPIVENHEDVKTEPSGNVQANEEQTLFNKSPNNGGNNISIMEEKKMSDVNENMNALLQAAESAAPDYSKEQEAPKGAASNVKNTEMKAARAQVANILGNNTESAQEYTIGKPVTQLVAAQKPNALRVKPDHMGIASTETTDAEIQADLEKKFKQFLVAVSGDKEMTAEKFAGLTNEERYANVYCKDGDTTNLIKAAAMYDKWMEILQNPKAEYPAFVTERSKLSFAAKGYAIDGKFLPNDEFIAEVLDKSLGMVFAPGMVNAQGEILVDDKEVVRFTVGVTTKSASKAQTGLTTASGVERKVPVVRVSNKKDFTKSDDRIKYLYGEEAEFAGRAPFKAAINVNGELLNASVPVYALDNDGKKQVRSSKQVTDKETKAVSVVTTYKTKMTSITLSCPVQKVVKVFAADIKGDQDVTACAERWGVNPPTTGKSEAGLDLTQKVDISAAPKMRIFAEFQLGNLTPEGALKGTEAFKALINASRAEEEANAAAAADTMGM